MEARYNVYFAGGVMEGYDPLAVRGKLGKIFNANEPTLDKLFSGTAQLIKRDCDKAMALKYKIAMERAGAIAVIKASSSTPEASAVASSPQSRKMTAAERIAALAAAPDEDRYRQEDNAAAPAPVTRGNAAATAEPQPGNIVLAPAGTEVLREDERAEPVTRNIDTSALILDSAGQRLSEEAAPPPPAPDTQHLSMGEVGDTIPTLPSSAVPLHPNLDGLALSAEGTDFSDCAPPAAAAPELDLSALEALPAGTAPAHDQQGRHQVPSAPATDHFSLQD
jgi:hypothetical protein